MSVAAQPHHSVLRVSLRAGRSCVGCSACCTTHGVAELRKGAGTPCGHLSTCGTRCSIYRDRPLSCKVFECGWRMGIGRDEHSPVLTGIVMNHWRDTLALTTADPLKVDMEKLAEILAVVLPLRKKGLRVVLAEPIAALLRAQLPAKAEVA